MLNIQIIGTKKCKDTRKAERFFRERGINYHFKDLMISELSPGELSNISRVISPEDLIDREGKQFKKRNLEYMVYNLEEELLGDPKLLKTPIVRNGPDVTLGYSPDEWLAWIK